MEPFSLDMFGKFALLSSSSSGTTSVVRVERPEHGQVVLNFLSEHETYTEAHDELVFVASSEVVEEPPPDDPEPPVIEQS